MAINQTFERTNVYKDFDTSFNFHPLTGDLASKSDVNSINQAIRNLVNTNYYERPFRPQIGCNIRALLFQPADPITVDDLRQAIGETIGNYEPRVTLTSIFIEDLPDRNAYNVLVTYRIRNLNQTATINIVLRRLR